MGRTGDVSPADHLLASIVGFLTFLSLPMLIPLAHRFGPHALRRAIYFSLSASALVVAIYAAPGGLKPFDSMHPQRLFVHQVHNVTSGQWWMNLGAADPAPPSLFANIAEGLQEQFGLPGGVAELQEMNERNPDFDVLYPVSDFITPYKFKLPDAQPGSKDVGRWLGDSQDTKFVVSAVSESLDLTRGIRNVTLQIDHPRIIWSVLAFDAEILAWDLPVAPPEGYRRHHIKEVSRFGQDRWSVALSLKLRPEELEAARIRAGSKGEKSGWTAMPDHEEVVRVDPLNAADTVSSHHLRDVSRLRIDYSGLWGEAMYPQAEKSTDAEVLESKGVETFRKMDAWLQKEHPEVDAMLLNVVAGVALV